MNYEELICWRMLTEEEIYLLLKQNVVLVRGNHSDERDEFFPSQITKDSKVINLMFDSDSLTLKIDFVGFDNPPCINDDDPVTNSELLACVLSEFNTQVLMDITSLPSETIFMLMKAFKDIGFDNVIAVYVQPIEYQEDRTTTLLPNYLLSEERSPISSIPGLVRLPNDLQPLLAVFLGFEGGRFQELYEYLITEGHTEVRPILPLPSYQAGWHMHCLYLNLATLKDIDILRELKRVTAWDPFHALSVLETLYVRFSDEHQIIVAPLGTKPHILASALFVVNHEDVRLMFDNPKVSKHRSIGIGKIRGYFLKGLLT